MFAATVCDDTVKKSINQTYITKNYIYNSSTQKKSDPLKSVSNLYTDKFLKLKTSSFKFKVKLWAS